MPSMTAPNYTTFSGLRSLVHNVETIDREFGERFWIASFNADDDRRRKDAKRG